MTEPRHTDPPLASDLDRIPGAGTDPAAVAPREMREALESARRRLVEDRLGDDLPRTAAELRAALREALALADPTPPDESDLPGTPH